MIVIDQLYAYFISGFVLLVAYLGSLEDPDCAELALQEYKTATNLTDQFAALAAIAQNPGKVRDDVLADFYSKWQNDFLVNFSFILQFSFQLPPLR